MISTNVDSAFINAGFDESRLFYTQGDYGLFQCTKPCHYENYDNKEVIRKMIENQGFIIEADGNLTMPPEGVRMEVSKDLIPYCPKCGSPMVIRMGKRSFILKDGELTNKAFLSSGTKSGIAVADILYSIKEEGQGLYFCDEKFSYINSVSTWYLYGSRGEARKRIDSRVGRLKSGLGWLSLDYTERV